MPSYTTVDNVYTVFPPIGSVTSITSQDICAFIVDAEALINGYIAKRYTIPQSGNPHLQRIGTFLTTYDVLSKRFFTKEKINNSVWPDRYKEALDELKAISEGEILLVGADGTVVTGRTDQREVDSNTRNYTPTFDPAVDFTQTEIDPDRVDDELDNRNL